MVTADLNNDGNQDIVVLNTGVPPDHQNCVSVLLGNGDGTFQPAITTNLLAGASAQRHAIAVGDFNGDGNLDVAIANRLNNVVEVLRGNGDGTFQQNPLLLPAPGAGSVVVADFLHNGQLDLAVSDTTTHTVSVFLGNGDGTFQPAQDIATGDIPGDLAAVDLGNGQVDLVVTTMVFQSPARASVTVFLGNGDGTFQQGQTIFSIAAPPQTSVGLALSVGDFNGDGNPDVFVDQTISSDGSVTSESVLLGNGDGTFQAPISQFLGGLAVGDFNGDGKLDVATGGFSFFGIVSVSPGNGDGTFGSPSVFPSGSRGINLDVATGDFNGDGRPDLAVANFSSNSVGNVGVLLNTSTVATATTLSADVNPAVVGQTVNLTAMVTGPAGIPTGTVTFMGGGTVLGTATLDGTGTASVAVAFTSAGDHAVTAVYSGDGSSDASTSDVLTETVTPAPTAVVLSPSVDTGMSGVPVDFTVTVSPVAPGAGTPTGTVTLFDGATALGTAPLGANGQVVFTFAFDAGDHSLTVSYAGDGNFQPGLSDPLAFPVT
jgi:hypothetical protein